MHNLVLGKSLGGHKPGHGEKSMWILTVTVGFCCKYFEGVDVFSVYWIAEDPILG